MTRPPLVILASLALASAALAEQTLPSRSLSCDALPAPAPIIRPAPPVAPGLTQAPRPLFTPLAISQLSSPPSLCVTIPATVDGILDKRQALASAWASARQGAGSGNPYYSTGKLKSYFVAGTRVETQKASDDFANLSARSNEMSRQLRTLLNLLS
ncbi:MAG: hypothetical protein PHS77_05075 [Gallionellaceae bacterium]|nr:hypothetical protein [Gallionellaceae bacterium]